MAEWQEEVFENITNVPLNPVEIIFSSLGEPGETNEKYLWNPQPGGPSWPS